VGHSLVHRPLHCFAPYAADADASDVVSTWFSRSRAFWIRFSLAAESTRPIFASIKARSTCAPNSSISAEAIGPASPPCASCCAGLEPALLPWRSASAGSAPVHPCRPGYVQRLQWHIEARQRW
jgi:hypothetical protein